MMYYTRNSPSNDMIDHNDGMNTKARGRQPQTFPYPTNLIIFLFGGLKFALLGYS